MLLQHIRGSAEHVGCRGAGSWRERACTMPRDGFVTPLTPALSPLRGEGARGGTAAVRERLSAFRCLRALTGNTRARGHGTSNPELSATSSSPLNGEKTSRTPCASCAPEPGRDAFHRVPIPSGKVRDAVECVPTLSKGRFMGSFDLQLGTRIGAMNRVRNADFSPQDRGDVGHHRKLQARWPVPGSCGLKSACRFMESPLFPTDLLTGHEPGRDAFHRVPILAGEVRDAVECVPTLGKGRFMGSPARRLPDRARHVQRPGEAPGPTDAPAEDLGF